MNWSSKKKKIDPKYFSFESNYCERQALGRGDINIKWKVFCYFLVFNAIMLSVLWLFQVVLLDDFYKAIKIRSIKNSAEQIARELVYKNYDLDALGNRIVSVSQATDVCIILVDPSGLMVRSPEFSNSCVIHNLSGPALLKLIATAKENDNTLLYNLDLNSAIVAQLEGNQDGVWLPDGLRRQGDMPESLIYVDIVVDKGGREQAILINSSIKPVDATVQTLTVQLWFISALMVVIALILALTIAKRISNPIIKLNNASKALAKGNFDIDFACNGYREIVELGNTLHETAKELGKAEGLQRDFIANISHDLRTPLTMITGYAQVMRDLPGENTPENLQVIIDEANRLTSLVNGVLDISKLQSGTETLQTRAYNLSQSIREIIGRFGKLKADEGYVVVFDADEDVWVEGDELKLSQVIYNLIINAITYIGEDHTVCVKQVVSHDRRQTEKVRIHVIDQGEGIAEEQLKDIWQRYYKLDKNHKRSQIGTGLGLSIVSGVLALHKADFGVESTLGKGSDFWFELKLVQPVSEEIAAIKGLEKEL